MKNKIVQFLTVTTVTTVTLVRRLMTAFMPVLQVRLPFAPATLWPSGQRLQRNLLH